ncbi:hypothetical protein JI435_408780 [Parastagonospora nodorum SN15]|uniref:Uncharacterized protein n=1 Tax=Phaeosphaeria nodorum (strain SN15 / ATCC MYA-4574 / FGSC 10173) TaxID=321614 RepID=A0A7U2F4G1_PHANO|nr:hypothetical protein JI435_408780 [Parastagonospora nodorum SN15]
MLLISVRHLICNLGAPRVVQPRDDSLGKHLSHDYVRKVKERTTQRRLTSQKSNDARLWLRP